MALALFSLVFIVNTNGWSDFGVYRTFSGRTAPTNCVFTCFFLRCAHRYARLDEGMDCHSDLSDCRGAVAVIHAEITAACGLVDRIRLDSRQKHCSVRIVPHHC